MAVTIHPGRVGGRIAAPPSKSVTHRAYILAALSGNGLIRNPLRSDDTEATLECLRRLGCLTTEEVGGQRVGGVLRAAKKPLDARESGTTLRMLPAVAALLGSPTRFEAGKRLTERPLAGLLSGLSQLGARVDGDHMPFTVTGSLQGGMCRIATDETSQVLSGLLMVAPLLPNETRIEVATPVRSAGYVDLTLALLRERQVRVDVEATGFRIPPAQRFRQKAIDVPGDYSSAAFPLAAAAVTGGEATVSGLAPDDLQPDRAIGDLLAAFGAAVRRNGDEVSVQGGPLSATTIDVGPTPDLFPVLCAVAAVARGTSHLRGAPHLRGKESDRIRAMSETLRGFGIACEELPDGLSVTGGRPHGTAFHGHGDHRVALAASVLALAADGPSTLTDETVASKSYPAFFADLAELQGEVAR